MKKKKLKPKPQPQPTKQPTFHELLQHIICLDTGERDPGKAMQLFFNQCVEARQKALIKAGKEQTYEEARQKAIREILRGRAVRN